MNASSHHPRLLHIHLGEKGGAEKFFVHLVRGLAERGVKQSVIIRKDRVWRDDLVDVADIYEFDFSRSHVMRFIINRRIAKIVNTFKPNAILAWMGVASRWVPSNPPAGVLTATRLGDYPETLDQYIHSRKLICNTPDIAKRSISLGHPPDETHMISNFTEVRKASPINRKVLDTPDDAFIVVSSGRFVERKGFKTLIEAMRFVPDSYLWLLGDGETRDDLVEAAKRHGLTDRLRMPGWVPDTSPYIAAGNIFCCPSIHEPLGNVVLEGWAQEIPVVATASEGPSWLIRHRENGLLTPLEDATALGNAFQYIRTHPAEAEKIARSGYLALQNQFSKDNICNQYMDLLFAESNTAHYAD